MDTSRPSATHGVAKDGADLDVGGVVGVVRGKDQNEVERSTPVRALIRNQVAVPLSARTTLFKSASPNSDSYWCCSPESTDMELLLV